MDWLTERFSEGLKIRHNSILVARISHLSISSLYITLSRESQEENNRNYPAFDN